MPIANRLQGINKVRTSTKFSVARIGGITAISIAVLSSAYAIEAAANNGQTPPASNSSTKATIQAKTDTSTGNTAGQDASTSQSSVNVSTTTNGNDQSSTPSTSVSVNGEPVDVPDNGTVTKTTVNGNTTTTTTVSHSTTGQASSVSNSSVHMNVDSHDVTNVQGGSQ